MRKHVQGGLCILFGALLLAGCVAATQPPPELVHQNSEIGKNPERLIGRWVGRWNSRNPRWGGGLNVDITSVTGSQLGGTVVFYYSDCPWDTPFRGSFADATVVLSANLGGLCGKVTLKLAGDTNTLRGSYTADYPDEGSVFLKRK